MFAFGAASIGNPKKNKIIRINKDFLLKRFCSFPFGCQLSAFSK